ncbi:MAG TPA: protein-disulfide reductase DsbD [Burkholderiales bacterium]|nr:protein-disulfide reductase DsbD [Burkholderiales bacterium]
MLKRVLFLFFLMVKLAFAADYLPSWQAFQVKLDSAGEKNALWVKFNIAPEYHLYQNKIKIQSASDSSVVLGDPVWPDPVLMKSPDLGTFKVYEGKVAIRVPILKRGDGKLKAQINFQGCKGLDLCFPEQQVVQELDLDHPELAVNNTQAHMDTSKINDVSTTEQSFWSKVFSGEVDSNTISALFAANQVLVIAGFFMLGLLIAFTPCVFPLLPVLIGVISGQNVSTKRSFSLALSYILGGALTYAVAGVVAAGLGYSLSSFLQASWLSITLSILFFIFALSMFGAFNLQLPSGIQNKLNQVVNKRNQRSLLSAFIIGGVSNLILSPCVTAPLAGALIYISTTGDRVLGGSALFALGLGSGIPLLIIAVMGKKFLPKSGNWMIAVKYFLGYLMLLMAIYMLSKVVSSNISNGLLTALGLALCWQLISAWLTKIYQARLQSVRLRAMGFIAASIAGASVMLFSPHALVESRFQLVTSNSELQQALSQAQQQNKPVLLDYYASWCVACKEMDLRTFSDPAVAKLMDKYALIRIDVSKNSTEIQSLQQRYKVLAPPSIVFLDNKGIQLNNYNVTGFISSNQLISNLEGASSASDCSSGTNQTC